MWLTLYWSVLLKIIPVVRYETFCLASFLFLDSIFLVSNATFSPILNGFLRGWCYIEITRELSSTFSSISSTFRIRKIHIPAIIFNERNSQNTAHTLWDSMYLETIVCYIDPTVPSPCFVGMANKREIRSSWLRSWLVSVPLLKESILFSIASIKDNAEQLTVQLWSVSSVQEDTLEIGPEVFDQHFLWLNWSNIPPQSARSPDLSPLRWFDPYQKKLRPYQRLARSSFSGFTSWEWPNDWKYGIFFVLVSFAVREIFHELTVNVTEARESVRSFLSKLNIWNWKYTEKFRDKYYVRQNWKQLITTWRMYYLLFYKWE